jgi:hypothetical protein
VHRRLLRHQRRELLRIPPRDHPRLRLRHPHPPRDRAGPGEGRFHGHLLIQQRPHHQRERTAAEQRIGIGLLREME